MTKRPSILQIVLVITFLFLTLASGILYFMRSQLPYNSEGRYFDEVEEVVYLDQSLGPILMMTLILFGLLMATLVWTLKTVKK